MTLEDSSAATTSAARRKLLVGGVAGVAALAGAGLAWRHAREDEPSATGFQDLWAMSFATPDGQPLAMQSLRGKPLLLNFWATWCPPCVEELPLIDGFYKQNSPNGWQVVGLAIDQPSSVRNFLRQTPVSFPIGLAGLGGTELAQSLGNLSGGLPFTVLVSAGGQALHRRMGRLTPVDLRQWASLR